MDFYFCCWCTLTSRPRGGFWRNSAGRGAFTTHQRVLCLSLPSTFLVAPSLSPPLCLTDLSLALSLSPSPSLSLTRRDGQSRFHFFSFFFVTAARTTARQKRGSFFFIFIFCDLNCVWSRCGCLELWRGRLRSMPDESNGEKDELADLLAEEGVVQWKERALQAAVLAPLLRDKQLQLNKRRKGKSPTAALQSFLEQQHRDVALSSGYSSRAVRAALQQVTSRLNDIRPEDQQESNDTWLQLRLQQQFLLAHRRFRKLQRQKFKKQRQEVEASTSDKSERSLSTGSAHANSHGATSQTSKSRPRLVLRLGSSKRNKKTDNQGKADPGAAAPNKREQTVDGVPGGQRFSRVGRCFSRVSSWVKTAKLCFASPRKAFDIVDVVSGNCCSSGCKQQCFLVHG